MRQTSKPSGDSLFVASSRRNYVLWEMTGRENIQEKAEDNAGGIFNWQNRKWIWRKAGQDV